MITFKKINLNCQYYFFNDMIRIKKFDPDVLSINKISYKNTVADVYNIKYIIMESINNQNIDSENPLCLILNDVDEYIIEKRNENKYLVFALIKNNKKVLGIYRKFGMKLKIKLKQ